MPSGLCRYISSVKLALWINRPAPSCTWKHHWLAHWFGSSLNILLAASPESQFWKFSFGSGFTRLRSTAGGASLQVDNSLRTDEFLDCISSASVETTKGDKTERKVDLDYSCPRYSVPLQFFVWLQWKPGEKSGSFSPLRFWMRKIANLRFPSLLLPMIIATASHNSGTGSF